MIKKCFLVVMVYCFLANWGFAQSGIPIAEFIQQSVDGLYELPKKNGTNPAFRAAWIDGLDIRTETDEFDFNRQRYLFRIAPSTPKIRKAQTNLYQSYQQKALFQTALLRNDFIEIAYEEVLAYYEVYKKKMLKEALLLVLQDQELVWRKLSPLDDKMPKDWLKVQQDISTIEIDIFRLNSTLEKWENQAISLDWASILPVENILNKIERKPNQAFQLQKQKFAVDRQEIISEEALELAEQKKLLDFVQIEYNGPHTNSLDERVSLTAAFQLPFSANRKLKMEKLAIEQASLEQEKLIEQQLNNYEEKEGRNHIRSLIKSFLFTQKKYNAQNEKIDNFSTKSQTQSGGTPLFALYQKETKLKNDLDLLKLEMTIYQEYLKYLSLTEQLYQDPFDKFLSK